MIRRNIVVVDYGLGNQASVQGVVQNLGHRCVITKNIASIVQADLVILPGVGAFPSAMAMLHAYQLSHVLIQRGKENAPILGICLGMQLLVDSSDELEMTQGLGLIPGQIKPVKDLRWHIGWNKLDVKEEEKLLLPLDGQSFFFNHSYAYDGSEQFVMATVQAGNRMPAAIRSGKIVGVQFHPEKSQKAGRLLLSYLITSLCE